MGNNSLQPIDSTVANLIIRYQPSLPKEQSGFSIPDLQIWKCKRNLSSLKEKKGSSNSQQMRAISVKIKTKMFGLR